MDEKSREAFCADYWDVNEQELLANSLIWDPDFDCYVIPLYCHDTMPKGLTTKDVVLRAVCPSCKEPLYLMLDVYSELLTDIQYVSFTAIDEIKVLGICSNPFCSHDIIDLTDKIRRVI